MGLPPRQRASQFQHLQLISGVAPTTQTQNHSEPANEHRPQKTQTSAAALQAWQSKAKGSQWHLSLGLIDVFGQDLATPSNDSRKKHRKLEEFRHSHSDSRALGLFQKSTRRPRPIAQALIHIVQKQSLLNTIYTDR